MAATTTTPAIRTRIGVIGYRSWMAELLMEDLLDDIQNMVVCHEKSAEQMAAADYTNIDCMFVFAGRARPTEQEMSDERDLLRRLALHSKPPRKMIYISSLAVSDNTPYGKHKKICETILGENDGRQIIVLRAAAVFGPRQPINSTMLVPTIARDGIDTVLTSPNTPTKFISVFALVDHLTYLVEHHDYSMCGQPGTPRDIPGTFTLTPQQMADIYMTFEHYRVRGSGANSCGGKVTT